MRAILSFGFAGAGILGCATTAANTPPAATPKTQPMPESRPLPSGPVDPEATNFPYPYPVSFLELRNQGQTLKMAYLDVAPVDAKGAGAQPTAATPTSPPPAAEPAPEQGATAAPPPAPAAATPAEAGASAAATGQAAGAPAPTQPTAAQAAGTTQGNGRCVVLLHGKNFSASAWATTIELLTKQGFRVIAPDQIGFGKSSKPASYQYSFSQLAHNTRALLDSLKLQRCTVLGHSMGGMLAVRFALQYPSTTERLILLNPIGLEDYAMFVPYRTIDDWYADELKQTPETIREYQRTAYYDGAWKPEYERPMALVAGFTQHPDYARVAWSNALTYDMIFTQPIINELPRIRVPTRLIIGTRDKTALGRKFALPQTAAAMGDYTQLGKRARDAIPNSQLIELAGVGHCPQVEAFDLYSDALLNVIR